MRVTTAFNKMLAIPGAIMAGVEFGPEGIVAALRPASGRLTCPCGGPRRPPMPLAQALAPPDLGPPACG